jgi:hypothetical protein
MHDSIYRAPKIDLVARTREAEHWIRESTGRAPQPREVEAVVRIMKGDLPRLFPDDEPAGEV